MAVRRPSQHAFMALALASCMVMLWCWVSLVNPRIEEGSIEHSWVDWDWAHYTNGKPLRPSWNTTGNRRLFYNRVPKCASRSVGAVMAEVGPKLQYPMVASHLFWPLHLHTHKRRELVNYVNNLPETSIFNRHIHFIDFTQYGHLQPIYINIIREPVERTISNYYFQNEIYNWNMSLDECVSKRFDRCVGEENTHFLTPFFCGHHPSCRHSSLWSLQMAQRNVEKHYAFVGLTEALPECFQLAERLLPEYFYGAGEIYADIAKKEWRYTATSRKRTISNATRATLMTHMQVDIAFYQWAKTHFFHLHGKQAWNENTRLNRI